MNQPAVIRPFVEADLPQALNLFNSCVHSGEVIYSPLSREQFARDFFQPGMFAFSAESNGEVVGFAHGAQKTAFLPGQSHENTPAYLSCVFVAPAFRQRGIGRALVKAIEELFISTGKGTLACSDENPLQLAWRVPGTPGHDHNKAPGVEEGGAGYAFLQALGFEPRHREIAMYRDLSGYAYPDAIAALREALAREGVYTGRYDAGLDYDFDLMCDRVGSEYWRNVLRTEIAAWQKGEANRDPALWPDGQRPGSPRPILVATCDRHIVGFTGPVDIQKSGRGWFTGICVDPAYGRRGIGEVLFHLLMQEFVDEGAAFTTLFTGLENHAQKIYLRAGLRAAAHFAVMVKPLHDNAAYSARHF